MYLFRFYSNPQETNNVRVSIVGEHSKGMLKIAASRCSTKDNFVRRKGRSIAEGRLLKGKLYKEVPMDSCDIKTFIEIAKEAASDIANDATKVIQIS